MIALFKLLARLIFTISKFEKNLISNAGSYGLQRTLEREQETLNEFAITQSPLGNKSTLDVNMTESIKFAFVKQALLILTF